MPTDEWANCATCGATAGHHTDSCQEQNGGYPAKVADPVIPEAALRAWIEEQRPSHPTAGLVSGVRGGLLNDLSVFLDSLHAEPGTYHRG